MRTVLTQDRGPVRIVTLNRPERLNAITVELVQDLLAALTEADGDPSVRVVVLTGAGRAFCAGDDLHEYADQASSRETTQAYVEALQQVTRGIMLGRVPVVGAIHGWAVGGGLEWVLNCDLVVVGESARGFFPEMALGLFVTGGVTTLLPRIVGLTRARRLLMLGEHISADDMVAWGIAQWQVPDEVLLDEAVAVAQRLAALSERAVTDLRRALTSVTVADLEAAMAVETEATVAAFGDADTGTRVRAAAP
ncbi:MAG: enoyl-CoA hydratase/isomerase family protein [Candidatus Nanopelagicales bacterium]|jgi:enoyl-CoA hydratase/carnithine racemase|nr:enoyl-CoA hydratase/isomerase family protein [Candidatus Nanopelagicales bacterium]MDP4905699.1 enoyl-CoA hydratase/isomerase family protein [Candidatus Nanopelagicales bacterium]